MSTASLKENDSENYRQYLMNAGLYLAAELSLQEFRHMPQDKALVNDLNMLTDVLSLNRIEGEKKYPEVFQAIQTKKPDIDFKHEVPFGTLRKIYQLPESHQLFVSTNNKNKFTGYVRETDVFRTAANHQAILYPQSVLSVSPETAGEPVTLLDSAEDGLKVQLQNGEIQHVPAENLVLDGDFSPSNLRFLNAQNILTQNQIRPLVDISNGPSCKLRDYELSFIQEMRLVSEKFKQNAAEYLCVDFVGFKDKTTFQDPTGKEKFHLDPRKLDIMENTAIWRMMVKDTPIDAIVAAVVRFSPTCKNHTDARKTINLLKSYSYLKKSQKLYRRAKSKER